MVDKNQQVIDKTLDQEYKYGFTTDVDQTKLRNFLRLKMSHNGCLIGD